MWKKNNYYVVWVWKNTWIFKTWKECEQNIKWIKSARYKKFKYEVEAEKAFEWNWKDYYKNWKFFVDNKKKKPTTKRVSEFDLPDEIQKDVMFDMSICVDWACNFKWSTWDIEYQWLDLETWEYVFQSEVIWWGTNNIAEFLWITDAILYINNNNLDKIILSDSLIALSWVKRKVCNTNYKNIKNKKLRLRIEEALIYLKSLKEYPIMYKWDTVTWWENPADYWRK